MNPYLGMIMAAGFNFAPAGWALCSGQTMAISTNTALFSLLGTQFGGNGTTTFNLPDLQGRVPVGMGNGAGLSPYVIGQVGGTESATLLSGNIPSHSHGLAVNNSAGTTGIPGTTTYLAAGPATGSGPNAAFLNSFTVNAPNTTLNPGSIQAFGSGTPFSIVQPYLCVNYSVALVGIFPARN
ncbi:MAG: phage tail protein [Sphingobacteriales bacterium]